MELNIGQQVSYPSQGICLIEDIKRKIIGQKTMYFYALRILNDNSTILVPTDNAEAVGIRPIISRAQSEKLLDNLAEDFEEVSCDWKIRSREYCEKLQSGDVFKASDVLKKLTFLSREKKLSVREQTLLEKAKFLLVSEISSVNSKNESEVEKNVVKLVDTACEKHFHSHLEFMSAAVH